MANPAPLVMLSAGEASGDLHGASLFQELRQRMPTVRGIGMGSARMRDAGVDIRVDSSGIGVIGLAEIARHWGEINAALTTMKSLLRDERPDLLICIDYKEFNFRLARAAKSLGIRVLFYVSPQVWAWRRGRVKSYGRAVDHMAVIFPFEVAFYEEFGIPVTYVGHPLTGKVKTTLPAADLRMRFGLREGDPLIGLLPGSRSNEIRRLLPVLLDAAELLIRKLPNAHVVLFRAPTIDADLIDQALSSRHLPITVINGQDYDVVNACDAVATVSGTATLEVALLGRPMVIIYKLSRLSYWLGRLLVQIPHIGLPNILAGRGIVRELIQDEASALAIAGELKRILSDTRYRNDMQASLAEVRHRLGSLEGSAELAKLATRLLSDTPAGTLPANSTAH